MAQAKKIAFLAGHSPIAQAAARELSSLYGHVPAEQAEVIVALGGDGFMLSTLHATQALPAPVYGMNRGTIGFLMNEYSIVGLVCIGIPALLTFLVWSICRIAAISDARTYRDDEELKDE